ncbi:hypothetical protein NCAS_0F03470 [Naumovozyma castellii]|uniref:Kinesin motor domain-containing protein n=1 Tax=Naumovozyma castellii TaxID=27288 RepID=G0VH58_NAUCA|nr:hypothetical protein NCAS_0F03470 [Naumovozyma castellii CBS 4309]CCC70831.1 hypothetical protein NCAS_0F03470 [Naumovozyma castellii CBS 4309]
MVEQPTTPIRMEGNKRRNTTTPPPLTKQQSFTKSRMSLVPPSNIGNRTVSNPSSRLSSFHKDSMMELNQLQEELFQKKAKLDYLRDELNENQGKYQDLQMEWEKLYKEKNLKQQQLQLKENELVKLNEKLINKQKFLNEGHELHLQQLKAKNTAERNKISNDYRVKIEKLKQVKIKRFEDQRNELLNKVEDFKNKILTNDEALQNMLDEVEESNRKIKEEWLQKYHSEWKENLELNEKISKDIETLKNRISIKLEPEANTKKIKVEQLKNNLQALKSMLETKQRETSTLEEQIEQKKLKTTEVVQKRQELEEYIKNTELDLREINEILIKEETMRRSLHNELQELRGKIRVYCRIRPPLPNIESKDTAHIKVEDFDDDNGIQSMEVMKGIEVNNNNATQIPQRFKFDKIFNQTDTNADVFKEVGQLVQSSLDGYNVCIFAYGQTGSGKTYTMLRPKDGIIPSTIKHIFNWTKNLKERGWHYEIDCQFVEIYNENIIDLLRSSSNDDTRNIDSNIPTKHEIRHDQENRNTTITNIVTRNLDSEETADNILKRANKLRSTASTGSNEHSSRSHSIFIIHLRGSNSLTGEESYGILNLVDLAGSERINSSQVTGDRLRETQNINRSLSCLGDVIHALGGPDQGKRHIPFRNSKLTYLLQYSLTGNSKTLMFVNISPSANHINETINSLRFASKVNSTKMSH